MIKGGEIIKKIYQRIKTSRKVRNTNKKGITRKGVRRTVKPIKEVK